MEFQTWLEQQEAWQGVKDEILRFWRAQEDRPIYPRPIPISHSGSSYDQDAIRITGTSEFINSILARLKDFLGYESPAVELDVDYRQIVDKYEQPVPGRFVCYLRLREKERATK